MKILLVTTRFEPNVGGVEDVVKNLAQNLSKLNKVKIATTLDLNFLIKNRKGIKNKYILKISKFLYGFAVSELDPKYKDFEVKRFWINLPRSMFGYLSFPYRFPASIISLAKYLKNFKPDLINYHFPDDSAIYIWILLKFVKAPLVLNIHGNDLQVFYGKKFHSFFIGSLFNKASAIVVNSDYMRDEVLKRFPNFESKTRTIGNGVNVEEISSVISKSYFQEPYGFFVGRLDHKKGADILVKAFKKANIKGLKLLLEGKGPEFESLEKLVNDLNLSEMVKLTKGSLSIEEKLNYMKGAVFGVMPSRIEPFGIVALEMMASKLPIVASKTGGLTKIIEDNKTGLFFENENVDDLAEKMKKLYSNEKLRKDLVANAFAEVKKYDNKIVAKKYNDLFTKIHENSSF